MSICLVSRNHLTTPLKQNSTARKNLRQDPGDTTNPGTIVGLVRMVQSRKTDSAPPSQQVHLHPGTLHSIADPHLALNRYPRNICFRRTATHANLNCRPRSAIKAHFGGCDRTTKDACKRSACCLHCNDDDGSMALFPSLYDTTGKAKLEKA